MKTNTFKLFILLMSGFLCFDGFGQDKNHFDELFTIWDNPDKLQPGVSITVIKNNETVLNKSFGYANLEYQIPLNNKSVFDIASLAKQFTGFAIAKLIVDNQLDLNDSASKYLPEIEILDKEKITIKHLVYHTSGLRDIGELFAIAYVGENLTSKEALKIIRNQKELNFAAGTEYDYSNTNYVLLALIVERISGITIREWSDTNLFSPLKMKDSFVNDNPYEIIQNRAVAYYTDSLTFSFQQNNGMALVGSSAVYSTIEDMNIWLQFLQNETLFPEVFRLMKQKGELDNGTAIEYGFGLSTGSFMNEAMISHTGATPAGFRTMMAILPKQSLAISILSNWGNVNPIGDFGKDIINSFLPKSEGENPVDLEKPTANVLLTKDITDRYLGNYLFNEEVSVKIRRIDGDSLTVQLEGQGIAPIFPLTETEFDLPALESKLHFIIDSEGICENVEVWMGERKEGQLKRIKTDEKTPMDIDYRKYTGLFYSDELNILFEFGLSNNQLTITNTKGGEVALESKSKEVFVPKDGVASSLVFAFNEADEVSGLLLNRGSRVRNLRFTKIEAGQ